MDYLIWIAFGTLALVIGIPVYVTIVGTIDGKRKWWE